MTDTTEGTDPLIRAADFRRRVLAGEEITAEEYREALANIRTIRRQRAATAAPKKKAGKIDADSLLNDLI